MNACKYLFFLLSITIFAQQPLHGMNGIFRFLGTIDRVSAFVFRHNHIPVFMDDAKMIELTPEAQQKIISTRGLVGCIATVFYAKDKADCKRALLTHYSRGSNEGHLQAFAHQIKQLQSIMNLQEFNGAKCMIFTPNPTPHWGDNSSDDYDNHNAECQEIYDLLQEKVREEFFPYEVEVVRITYNISPPGKSYCTTGIDVILSNNEPSHCTMNGWLCKAKIDLE